MSDRTPKPPKRITAPRLRNVAIAYVRRYGGAETRLRTVLTRRVVRSLQFHGETGRMQECEALIERVIGDLKNQGVLDEGREAHAAALRLALGGRPRRMIAQHLRAKGFAAPAIGAAVASLSAAEGDETGDPVDPD